MKQLPSADEVVRIRREALLNRAVEAYKFFYPTVSMALNFEAIEEYGAAANNGFLIQLTTPDLVTLTQNSDTPYGLGMTDLSEGPVVVEVPPGPIMGVADDMNFQLVTNMGLVGVEEGKGAKYLFVRRATRAISLTRGTSWSTEDEPAPDLHPCTVPGPREGKGAAPDSADVPLAEAEAPRDNVFVDMSDRKAVANPCVVDGTFEFWNVIKRALDMDVLSTDLYNDYGMLADLGLREDRPFEPDHDLERSSPRQPRRPTSSSSWQRSPTPHPSDWSGPTGAGSGSSTPKATSATTSATSCTCRYESAGSIRPRSRPTRCSCTRRASARSTGWPTPTPTGPPWTEARRTRSPYRRRSLRLSSGR